MQCGTCTPPGTLLPGGRLVGRWPGQASWSLPLGEPTSPDWFCSSGHILWPYGIDIAITHHILDLYDGSSLSHCMGLYQTTWTCWLLNKNEEIPQRNFKYYQIYTSAMQSPKQYYIIYLLPKNVIWKKSPQSITRPAANRWQENGEWKLQVEGSLILFVPPLAYMSSSPDSRP